MTQLSPAPVRRFVSLLRSRQPEAIEALVADGYSEAMASYGLQTHLFTWNVDEIVAAARQELSTDPNFSPAEHIAHIWPALPGAGVTPVLYGLVAGVRRQTIRPSSRNAHFSRYLLDLLQQACKEITVQQEIFDNDADVLVVSGGDETVELARTNFGGRVVGYGHRISFAVLVEGALEMDWATLLAKDIILWHQAGCFSPRAVIWVGDPQAGKEKADELARAIKALEEAWSISPSYTDHARNTRLRHAVAFDADVLGGGYGFVVMDEEPFKQVLPGEHVVSWHMIADVDALPSMVQIPSRHIQGASASCASRDLAVVQRMLKNLGCTRVTKTGRLQWPEAAWPHDGMPNMLVLGRSS